MLLPTRRYRRVALIASVLGLFLLYNFFSSQRDSSYPGYSTRTSSAHHGPYDDSNPQPECPPLPGMEDVLVVMKTGVTEALDKVPVHFQTSFRCVPNYVVFSDFEEDINGVRVRDALRNMDPEVRQSVPDFDIYNRLRTMGREGLAGGDFADEANSAIGKPNNPGWKLDKWKFLPMVQETLRYKPDAKWYVFMEADTYFFWPNLLAWLQKFDARKPLYIGTETQIADVIFAHGGSGFIVSNPAMKMASNEYATRTAELNEYTNHHWAGDCVLGKVLHDVGVGLHYSWPLLQNSNLGELDEFITDLYRKPWCFPAIALHHLTNEDIKDLYQFERQRWLYRGKTLLLHGEIFKEKIYPELPSHGYQNDWDNLSGGDERAMDVSFEDCHDICESLQDCSQFSLRDGKCYTNKSPRLGVPSTGVRSGWMMDRVKKMMDAAPTCSKPDFG